MIADGQSTDLGAPRLHDTGAFVSEHDGHGNGYAAPAMTVQIGMTDARGDDPHTHLVDSRLLQLQFLDLWMGMARPRYSCLNFHRGSSDFRPGRLRRDAAACYVGWHSDIQGTAAASNALDNFKGKRTVPLTKSGMTNRSVQDRVRELIMGAWTTQVVHHGVSLKIFDALAAGAASYRAVATATRADPEGVFRLLRAAATLGLVRHIAADTFILTEEGGLLCNESPVSLRGVALHWGERIWNSLAALDQSVVSGKSCVASGPEDFMAMQSDPIRSDLFNRAMAEQSLEVGRGIARAYDFSKFGSVMDVGGGYGAVLRALLEHYPSLRGSVMDLPVIENGALRYLQNAGVGDRAGYRGGDFFESVPPGSDAYVLKYIVHDWDDEKAIQILSHCAAAAGADGFVLLIEQIVPEKITEADQRVIRGDLIMMTVGGKERTDAQYRELCAAAGLRVTRVVPTPSGFSVIETRL